MINEDRRRGGASPYIGRIGGLAVALGVGAVLLVGCDAVASAQTGTTESATSATSSSAAASPSVKPRRHTSAHSTTVTPKKAAATGSEPVASESTAPTPRSAAVTAKSIATKPITVNPTLTFSDGIIEAAPTPPTAGLTLTYTIVSAPSAGKIAFIPEEAAGTFGYLPTARC